MNKTDGLWIYTGAAIDVRRVYRNSASCSSEPRWIHFIHFNKGEALAMAAESKQEAEEKIIDWAKRYSVQNFIFSSRKIKRDELIVHIDRDSLNFVPVKRPRMKFFIDEGVDMAFINWPDEEVENDTN